MADLNGDISLLKKKSISVFVDEALPDILVVTYEFGLKIFKGVLLDSTKRNLPCGVPNLNPAFDIPKNPEDNPLYAVNQRFAYLDPNAQKKKVQVPNKYKNSKMTVRLRPRQVLCSKCKGICNENSENVSRKRKSSETVSNAPSASNRRSNAAPLTRSVKTYLSAKRKLRGYSQGEEEDTSKTKCKKSEKTNEKSPENPNWVDPDTIPTTKKPLSNIENEPQEDPLFIKHSEEHSQDFEPASSIDVQPPVFQQPTQTQVLRAARRTRKKKSTGTTDDEGSTSDQPSSANPGGSSGNITSNTRTIKISYGPQGEGTVLKIPAQIDNITDDDSEENVSIPTQGVSVKLLNTKAAKKAMKRAKKEARRKVLLGGSPLYLGGASPRYLTSPGASPRYTLGGSSPRYTVGAASPRQGLGNNSPRYMISPFELPVPRRRKHKVKHKKKHKEDKDRKHKESEVSSSTQDDSKEQYITQKLSINLKRLNNTYTSYSTPQDSSASSSDEHSELLVPDFPPPNPPLMLRINAQTLSSAVGADGVRLLVGDVVWGKIQGFPWWPGKILTITNCNSQGPQAHVAWYGSSTSSLMQCDQLSHYLDNFKVRYNKRKKGPYKEAIKQATTEATENAENRVRQPLGNSPSHNIIPPVQVVQPALASPREIDVAS
ncbi:PWWP domain-containing protein 2B-like isoform X2 [Anthonomus grandis grandis]|uniref:PWWP domain-containing protein 2B-like isoform X2 n=1 Tax=Anthonomus grandis grandis TaxID=2921223 RepID=UPI002166B792|nr:PWWP domain-containing protein 2B-like isoform X2 [Anthonomus grandis grandis]